MRGTTTNASFEQIEIFAKEIYTNENKEGTVLGKYKNQPAALTDTTTKACCERRNTKKKNKFKKY